MVTGDAGSKKAEWGARTPSLEITALIGWDGLGDRFWIGFKMGNCLESSKGSPHGGIAVKLEFVLEEQHWWLVSIYSFCPMTSLIYGVWMLYS